MNRDPADVLVVDTLAADALEGAVNAGVYRTLYLHTLGLLHDVTAERDRLRQRVRELHEERRAGHADLTSTNGRAAA